MRYQINAIVNMTPKDTDAFVQLLVARAEHLEIKALVNGDAPAGLRKKGGSRTIRYPRSAAIAIGPRPSGITATQGAEFDLLAKILGKAPMPRTQATVALRASLGDRASSASPLITQLLDAGGLKVVK